MPEYLAPGVYVEETSYRAKSIEGVSTTTTGFVGPTRYGPTDRPSGIITSMVEYERIYGGPEPLKFKVTGGGETEVTNYMWHAARAFFEEGGKRLYVSRIYRRDDSSSGIASNQGFIPDRPVRPAPPAPPAATTPPPDEDLLFINARFAGETGNFRVHIKRETGQNVLVMKDQGTFELKGVSDYDTLEITQRQHTSAGSSINQVDVKSYLVVKRTSSGWVAEDSQKSIIDSQPLNGIEVRIVTLTVSIKHADGSGERVWTGLAPDYRHRRSGTPDSIYAAFPKPGTSPSTETSIPIVVSGVKISRPNGNPISSPIECSGLQTLSLLGFVGPATGNGSGNTSAPTPPNPNPSQYTLKSELDCELVLFGGSDGVTPQSTDLEGYVAGATGEDTSGISRNKLGLKGFEDLEDISIVAAPGSTSNKDGAQGACNALIRHAQKMKYRIAVLDSPAGATISDIREFRAKFDSSHAAIYYPWIRTLDPLTNTEILLPPSGFVAGIYARNDINRAVYKAPANEVVTLALGFAETLNQAHQEVLNPEGINCFRYFEGRGNRLWGARTVSSDSEWKYVNVRRYFAYLERSIDRASQFAVFEPNGEALWANIRRMVEDFLFAEWQSGALLGDKPEKAFFVRCDRSTMNQNDLDNGRLVCLVGVAPLRPAEFVIFRVGQFTADRR